MRERKGYIEQIDRGKEKGRERERVGEDDRPLRTHISTSSTPIPEPSEPFRYVSGNLNPKPLNPAAYSLILALWSSALF